MSSTWLIIIIPLLGLIRAKIADFGLSVIRNKYKKNNDEPEIDYNNTNNPANDQSAGLSGVIHKGGTRVYWPPELITSLKFTKACEVYAFGIILLEIVFLMRPKEVKAKYDELMGKSETYLPDVFNQSIPPCLSIFPKKRPTFAELLSNYKQVNPDLLPKASEPEEESITNNTSSDINSSIISSSAFRQNLWRTAEIFVFGAIYKDVILHVNEYPKEDSKVRADSVEYRRGGNGANTIDVLAQYFDLDYTPGFPKPIKFIAALPANIVVGGNPNRRSASARPSRASSSGSNDFSITDDLLKRKSITLFHSIVRQDCHVKWDCVGGDGEGELIFP